MLCCAYSFHCVAIYGVIAFRVSLLIFQNMFFFWSHFGAQLLGQETGHHSVSPNCWETSFEVYICALNVDPILGPPSVGSGAAVVDGGTGHAGGGRDASCAVVVAICTGTVDERGATVVGGACRASEGSGGATSHDLTGREGYFSKFSAWACNISAKGSRCIGYICSNS